MSLPPGLPRRKTDAGGGDANAPSRRGVATLKGPRLDLKLRSDWSEVTRVNREVEKFLRAAGLKDENVYRFTMVACELAENAIKYGHFQSGREVLQVKTRISGSEITIQVTNPVGKTAETHLAELDRMIQWVRGFQDPFEAYLERMKAVSREPLDLRRSELGLIRVTYEGRAALDFVLDEDDMVSVSAVSIIE